MTTAPNARIPTVVKGNNACERGRVASLVMPSGTIVACGDWPLANVLAREVVAAWRGGDTVSTDAVSQ